MTATDFTPKCNFYSYNTRNGCREVATEAVRSTEWSAGKSTTVFLPRCKRHAAVEANKKYGPRERVDITDEMIAVWAAQKAKSDAAEAVRKAEQAERNRKSNEAHTARLWAENEVEYEVVRSDEENPDWSRPISERATITTPRWLVQPIGTTERYREVAEVKIEREAGRPDRVEVRNPSTMTPKAALHLAEAIKAAYGETK